VLNDSSNTDTSSIYRSGINFVFTSPSV